MKKIKDLTEGILWIVGVMSTSLSLMVMIYYKLIHDIFELNTIFLVLFFDLFIIFNKIIDWWSPVFINRKIDENKDLMELKVNKKSQEALFFLAFAITLLISGITSDKGFITSFLIVVGMVSFLFSIFYWMFEVESRYKALEKMILSN